MINSLGPYDYPDFVESATFQNRQLDHQIFGAMEKFIVDHGRFETEQSYIDNCLVRRLTVMMAGQTAVKDIIYPATWWDHFKQTFVAWMPIWATDPQMTTVCVRATRLYPEIIPVPGYRTTFVVERVR